MDKRIIFTLPLILLLCTAKVIANPEDVNDQDHPFSQSLKDFSNGADRNLMQDTVTGLAKYITPRSIPAPFLKHPAPPPAPAPAPAPTPAPSHDLDCDGKCKHRCSLHSRQNVCRRACGTCCVRCKCVPPGTFGNRELCGTCYTNMTTHGNRPKCP